MSCVSGDGFGFNALVYMFVVFRAFFLGLLRVVARLLRAGLGYGFSRCLCGVSYYKVYFQPFGTAMPAEVADPELQSLLRKHDVDERIIFEIGAQGVKTIADFVCLEGTEAERRNTPESSFGIDESMVESKVAIASNQASEYESVAPQCEVLNPLVD